MNLKSMLESIADEYGDKTAIVSGEQRITYSGLDKESNRIAHALSGLGIVKGDRVAMLLPNSPEFVTIYFGIAKLGAIVVPLDQQYRVMEIESLFNDCRPKALFLEKASLEQIQPHLEKLDSIEQLILMDGEDTGTHPTYASLLSGGSAARPDTDPEDDDVVQISYTSGSSLRPKGVMLTHGRMVEESHITADGYGITDADTMMLYALPMHHVYGLVSGMFSTLCKGGTVVIVPGTGLSIGLFMATVEKEKATVFIGVPYIYALAIDMAVKEGIKHDLSSLRLCASCGAPLPVETIHSFKQHYGFDILNCLGLTETTSHYSCQPLDGSGHPESVGNVLPGFEAKIVDAEGRELPAGESGEILIRGPIMKGYYNNEAATRKAVNDGWLSTGDAGYFGPNGDLYFSGRTKDIVILKGQNIEPVDIETVLLRHPAVQEVSVIGIPDKMRGEIVGAAVSLKPGHKTTEQKLRKYLLERITAYKVPKRIFCMESLPRNEKGRVDKAELRRRLSIPAPFAIMPES